MKAQPRPRPARAQPPPQLAVVIVQWLEVLVDLRRAARETQVVGAQRTHILVVLAGVGRGENRWSDSVGGEI